jgi:hypothetical protein
MREELLELFTILPGQIKEAGVVYGMSGVSKLQWII